MKSRLLFLAYTVNRDTILYRMSRFVVRTPLFFKGLFNAAIMMRLSYHRADPSSDASGDAQRAALEKNPKKIFEIDIEIASILPEPSLARAIEVDARRDRARSRARRASIEFEAGRRATGMNELLARRCTRFDLQAIARQDTISEQSNRASSLRARERTVVFVLTRIRGVL